MSRSERKFIVRVRLGIYICDIRSTICRVGNDGIVESGRIGPIGGGKEKRVCSGRMENLRREEPKKW